MTIERRTFAKMLAVGAAGCGVGSLTGCSVVKGIVDLVGGSSSEIDTEPKTEEAEGLGLREDIERDEELYPDPEPEPDPVNPYDVQRVLVEYDGPHQEVKVETAVVNPGQTYTGLPVLSENVYSVIDPENERGLAATGYGYSFGAASNGKPHRTSVNNQARFDAWGTNALCLDQKSTDGKYLYLTFDCGYKYQDTSERIMDVLDEKQCPACFFVTGSYLLNAADDVTRMIKSGYTVGSHTWNHPSTMETLSRVEMAKELLLVDNYLRVNFGYTPVYFRFPAGHHSQEAVDLVNSLGYRTVFWTNAHRDWLTAAQPDYDTALKTIEDRLHAGSVILLHALSTTNCAILGEFIDYARAQGYVFRSLDDCPCFTN